MADSHQKTPAATSTEAAQKVFGLPELLENILMHLPLEKIFAFQRVNSTFHDTVKDSRDVRKAMCLETPAVTKQPRTHLAFNSARILVDHHVLNSPAIIRAMYPLQHLYSFDDGNKLHINFDATYSWYNAGKGSAAPTFGSHGSWRHVKVGCGRSPIVIEFRYWSRYKIQLAPNATLGELVDKFTVAWKQDLESTRWRMPRKLKKLRGHNSVLPVGVQLSLLGQRDN